MDTAYVIKIKEALADLDLASAYAEAALPTEIKTELKAARRALSTVSLVRSIANGHMDNLEMQALAIIQDFRNSWRALEGDISAQGRPVDLSVGQHRQR